MIDISSFLNKNPSIPEILKFVDDEAHRIIRETEAEAPKQSQTVIEAAGV